MALTVAAMSLVAAFLLVLTPGMARADCAVLNTSCVAETVEETTDDVAETVETIGGDTVGETVEDVGETVEDVGETVEDTVDEVVEVVDDAEETVNETAREVAKTVDDTVGSAEDTVDAVDPAAPLSPGGPEPGSKDPPGGGRDPDPGGSVTRPDAGDRVGPALELDLVAETAPASETVIATDALTTSPIDPLGAFAGSIPEVARRLAFPLVLVGLVLGFVAIQNRVDRKDPKLALATTTPDVLSFA